MPVVNCVTEEVRDHTSQEQTAIDAALAAAAPQPIEQTVAAGYATVSGSSVSSVDGFGFLAASRVAVGRIRFYFTDAQPDTNYFAQVTVRHTSDVMVRVNGKTTAYVEVKTNSIEALEYGVTVTRISR